MIKLAKLNKLLKYVSICIFCILLTNCSMFQQKKSSSTVVSFMHGKNLVLPKPAELAMNISATQIINAKYGAKSYSTESVVEASPEKITLVALSGMGTPLFTIVYDGISIKTSYLPMPHINKGARQALLNFILSYSSEGALHEMLKGSGITLKSTDKQRLFIFDNKVIVKISYKDKNPWEGWVKLENKQDNYTVNIDNISVTKHK